MQYHQGKSNALDYRVARRDAHNCDAELASVISNMSAEPKNNAQTQESAFRLLCLNHTLLSYISALGAHRDRLNNAEVLSMLDDAACYMDDALNYDSSIAERTEEAIQKLKHRLTEYSSPSDNTEQLVVQQISLMMGVLPELMQLKQGLMTS